MDSEECTSPLSKKTKLSCDVPSEESACENENDLQLSLQMQTAGITKPGCGKAIQIILFPPKNKQFCLDDDCNVIGVEPLTAGDDDRSCRSHVESKPEEQVIACLDRWAGQSDNSCQNSTLTPILQQCDITSGPFNNENSNLHNDRANNDKQEVDCTKPDNKSPEAVFKISSVFKNNLLGEKCFLKGCKWSPDGCCLLTSSDDNILRLFDFPQYFFNNVDIEDKDAYQPALETKEGGTIYDYVWYPQMDSCNPATCVFASTSQDSPVHLWDAYTGSLRATYQPINQYDEVTNAYSLSFSPDGKKLYTGFKKRLRIFDVSIPGRISEERNLKSLDSDVFQSNIISSIAINSCFNNVYALGSYDKTIGIYTEPDGELQCLLKGQIGGLTHLMFSQDGRRLYSGGRKDPEILCWDLRKPGNILFTIQRTVDTNQRIYFDLMPNGSYLVTGCTDGRMDVYETKSPSDERQCLKAAFSWKGHSDCVNGVSFHPSAPLLASASGQRHLSVSNCSDEDDDDASPHDSCIENSIKIWSHWWS